MGGFVFTLLSFLFLCGFLYRSLSRISESSQSLDRVYYEMTGARVLESRIHEARRELETGAGILGFLLLWLAFMFNREVSERRYIQRRLAIQYSAARILAKAATFEEATGQLLAEIGHAMDWKAGALWQVDPNTNQLLCVRYWHRRDLDGPSIDDFRKATASAGPDSLSARARTMDEPVWDDGRPAEYRALRGLLAVPIRLADEFLGAFEFFGYDLRFFDEEMAQAMRSIGNQVGQFIERKRGEQALLEARQTALESVRFKSEFMANMSHEIRTPMNAIIGMTDMLTETAMTPEQREYTGIIHQAGETLLQIINDILDFSKIEAGKFQLENVPFDLRDTVESILQMLAPRAQTRGTDLGCLIQQTIPSRIQGDPTRLRQVITNLVGNAVKFTEKGAVTVKIDPETTQDGKNVLRFQVVDTGIGISPEGLKKLFQAFSQADGSTSRKYGGTGLGLAISKNLIELMGGEIGVESQPGRGSTFWFTLPLNLPASTEETAEPPGTAPMDGKRVLIVDDQETGRAIIRHHVSAWGLVALEAGDGAAALMLLRREAQAGHPFDLAILDMQMPQMDGLTLAQAIRSDPKLSGVSLLILTSLGQRIPAETMQDVRLSACLTKPVRQNDLFTAIQTALSGSRDALPAQKQPTPAAESNAHSVPAPVAINDRKRMLRILVAEDNAVNQRVVAFQLKKLGCEATIVSSGRKCSGRWKRSRLIWFSWIARCRSSTAFRQRRRSGGGKRRGSHPENPRRTSIVAMTANALEGDRERCLEAGMDDYISKPVKLQDLGPSSIAGRDLRTLPRLRSIWPFWRRSRQATVNRWKVSWPCTSGKPPRHCSSCGRRLNREIRRQVREVAHGSAGASTLYGMTGLVGLLRQLEILGKTGGLKARRNFSNWPVAEFERIRTFFCRRRRKMDPVTAGKKKILIVEDQESIRKFYRTVLEGAGYSVLEAEDGEKGWSWAEAVGPDLILTDLMMPRMNGFDLLQKVRANAQTHDIPVLFLTLRGEDENAKKAMSLGANGFLVKGYVPPKVMLEKIRAALLPASQ